MTHLRRRPGSTVVPDSARRGEGVTFAGLSVFSSSPRLELPVAGLMAATGAEAAAAAPMAAPAAMTTTGKVLAIDTSTRQSPPHALQQGRLCARLKSPRSRRRPMGDHSYLDAEQQHPQREQDSRVQVHRHDVRVPGSTTTAPSITTIGGRKRSVVIPVIETDCCMPLSVR